MFKFILFISISTFAVISNSKTRFSCYQVPNVPLQAFVAGSINCEKKPTKDVTMLNNKPTKESDILCMYQAICEPLADSELPTKLSPKNVAFYSNDRQQMDKTGFRPSNVSCRGTGATLNGQIVDAKCPTMSNCVTDILFNAQFAMPVVVDNSISDQPSINKTEVSR